MSIPWPGFNQPEPPIQFRQLCPVCLKVIGAMGSCYHHEDEVKRVLRKRYDDWLDAWLGPREGGKDDQPRRVS